MGRIARAGGEGELIQFVVCYFWHSTFRIMVPTKTASKSSQLLRLARRGPIRARDLAATGIPRAYLTRLVKRGQLDHAGRGLYRLPEDNATELHSLAEVAARVPRATICLLSALQMHGLTTEAPHAVWIMIESRSRTPKLDTPTIVVVRAHGPARDHGVETRDVEGIPVAVTSPAKTVADCFRYRRHVGLDVALAALREYLQARRPVRRGVRKYGSDGKAFPTRDARGADRPKPAYTIDALVTAARADRVYSVLRPYLEALG